MLLAKKIRMNLPRQNTATLEFMQVKCRALYNWHLRQLKAGAIFCGDAEQSAEHNLRNLNMFRKAGISVDKFGLYTKFRTQEGQRDSLVGMLLEAASRMESVEGCDLYIVNIPENEPDSVWVTEIWNDPSAHQASLSLEQSKMLIQKARPLIAGMEQIKLRSVGGKGI